MNIFRSLGRAASKAARAIKPKRIHGPKHGAKAFLKKHAKLAAILGAGVGVGAGAEGLIELAKGKSEEEPPIIMLGGELSEHKTTDDSWNFLRFDTENDNFSEEKTILDIQTTDPNTTADHNDSIGFERAHASHHGNHHGEFFTRMKTIFIVISVIILIMFLLKMRVEVRKWLKWCFKGKEDKAEPLRLEITQDEWQSHTKGLPQGISQAETSFVNGSFLANGYPPYNPMMATAPNTGTTFYDKMTILQDALKLSNKTQAIYPTSPPGHAPNSSLAPVHTVPRYSEENVRTHAQELSSLLTSPWIPTSPDQSTQPPIQEDPPQPNAGNQTYPTPAPRLSLTPAQPQAPVVAIRLPNPFPVYTLAPGPSGQPAPIQDQPFPAQTSQAHVPANPSQTNQEATTSPTPASISTMAQAAKPQATANGLWPASLARLRKSNKPGPGSQPVVSSDH